METHIQHDQREDDGDEARLEAPVSADEATHAAAARAGSPKGMTLVEIMIVITIMASIMGVVGFYVFGTLNQANKKNAKIGIDQLNQIVQTYYMMQGQLPESLNELTEGDDPLVKEKSKLNDPWGNKYIYQKSGGQDYTIKSAGPDGNPGTKDDVTGESEDS